MMNVLDAIPYTEDMWRIATGVGAVFFVLLLMYFGNNYAEKQMGAEKWKEYYLNNIMFVVGIPMSMVAAFGLVVYFEITSSGPIEVKIWEFELKGPAGPLMMWVVVFLAIVLGMKVLGKK